MIKNYLTKLIASGIMVISIVSFNSVKANAQWYQSEGLWHYKEGNKDAIGWRYISGNWYYFWGDGSIITNGVDKVGGKIYYFDKSGAMKTGWIYVNNDYLGNGWHYFYSDGSMATNTTIEGYYVNSTGLWK